MVVARRRRFLVLGVTIAVVGAVVIASAVLLPPRPLAPSCVPGPPPGLTHDQKFVLAACDSTVTLGPHSFTSYTIVRLSDQMTVLGQFTATPSINGSLGAYLLNSSEFGELLANPSPAQLPSEYFWSSGPGPVSNISVVVPGSPGQYYIAIENAGATGISILWTLALVIYYGTT